MPSAALAIVSTAGSLVLHRMDRREHKRDIVRTKKHGTKSGSGAPLRRDFSWPVDLVSRAWYD